MSEWLKGQVEFGRKNVIVLLSGIGAIESIFIVMYTNTLLQQILLGIAMGAFFGAAVLNSAGKTYLPYFIAGWICSFLALGLVLIGK